MQLSVLIQSNASTYKVTIPRQLQLDNRNGCRIELRYYNNRWGLLNVFACLVVLSPILAYNVDLISNDLMSGPRIVVSICLISCVDDTIWTCKKIINCR